MTFQESEPPPSYTDESSSPSTLDRPLPPGWIRKYDPTYSLPFWVDTNANPPRSIWTHPLDDPEFLSRNNNNNRSEKQQMGGAESSGIHAPHITGHEPTSVTMRDQKRQEAEAQAEAEALQRSHASSSQPQAQWTEPRQNVPAQKTSGGGLGHKLKDKMTGTSHDDRAAQRAERDAAMAFANANQAAIVQGLAKAKDTGYPAHVGRDQNGHDVFVEPPAGYSATPMMASSQQEMAKMRGKSKGGLKVEKGMEMGLGRGFGVQQGYDPYRDENARFIFPLEKDKRGGGPRGESGWGYGREYAYGYGYGYGYGGMGMGMGMMMGMGMW